MQNLFLGASAHGSSSGTKWILALDENCGPLLPGVSFDFGRPHVSIALNNINQNTNLTSNYIKYNQDYWTTAHMSKFIPFGATRVSTKYSSNGNNDTTQFIIETFQNDDGMITSIMMNLNHFNNIQLQINAQDISFNNTLLYILPPWSTAVLTWIIN